MFAQVMTADRAMVAGQSLPTDAVLDTVVLIFSLCTIEAIFFCSSELSVPLVVPCGSLSIPFVVL